MTDEHDPEDLASHEADEQRAASLEELTEAETEDDNPLHVPVKGAHADELVSLLARYGYSELSEAFRTAEVGETIEVKIVED
jgi:hypothetical protein